MFGFNNKTKLRSEFEKKPLISGPKEVAFGYSDFKKQFNHVITGAQLKMETFLKVEHCIYAISKSLNRPLKIIIEYPITSNEDLVKILSAIGINLAEEYPDIECFIYQSAVQHPTLENNKTANSLSVKPVPTVIVFAQEKNGKKKFFLKQFHLEVSKDRQIPKGWVRNKSYEEINKLGWINSQEITKKYILFDLPLSILWKSYNSSIIIKK